MTTEAMPSERALQMAARCWCEPSTEHLVMSPELATVFAKRADGYIGLIESAWGIIANANNGNWDETPLEWRQAATAWREKWHLLLDDKYEPVESIG